jgi:DNA-binding transcriptional LysR family regulator
VALRRDALDPRLSLNLSAAHTQSDFALGQADLDIRYGVPTWGELVVEPLFAERIVPLIHSNVSVMQWADWFKAFSDKRAPEHFSVRFDRAQMSLDAATQGLGVALESTTVAGLHLAGGPLGGDDGIAGVASGLAVAAAVERASG